jgi:hypothetical protein
MKLTAMFGIFQPWTAKDIKTVQSLLENNGFIWIGAKDTRDISEFKYGPNIVIAQIKDVLARVLTANEMSRIQFSVIPNINSVHSDEEASITINPTVTPYLTESNLRIDHAKPIGPLSEGLRDGSGEYIQHDDSSG